jgi:hypothetical protein
MQPKPITVANQQYLRFPVKTHLIHIKESIDPLIERLVVPNKKPGDWLALSEKFVAIAQGRVIHESVVRAGWLARLLVKGVRKYKDDIGYSHPKKMQVAIMQAGWWRMFFAMIIGSLTRLFGRHGDFWRIAGHRVSEIDGFNPDAMPPFDEFAMLGPADPDKSCQEIEKKFGIPAVVIDGNNINVQVLGASTGMPVSRAIARKILIDNPMGQNDELTPMIIVRRA